MADLSPRKTIIDWDSLLGTDHKKRLAELMTKYSSMEKAAEYLGVAKLTLRSKLLAEGFQMRPRGGVNAVTQQRKSRLDAIPPAMFQEFPMQVLAEHFGVDVSALYKYCRRKGIKRKNESLPGESPADETLELSGEGTVGESELEVGERESDLRDSDLTGADAAALRLVQGPDDTAGGGTTK